MVSGGLNPEPIAPTVIIVPTENGTALRSMTGALVMSGSKLYVMGASKFELVSSA